MSKRAAVCKDGHPEAVIRDAHDGGPTPVQTDLGPGFRIVQVTSTQDYVLPLNRDGSSFNGQTVEDIVTQWFVEADPNRFHASRDGSRMGNSVRVLDVRVLGDETDRPAGTEEVDPCVAKREAGEPMFVLLARDSAAPGTMEQWADAREDEMVQGVRVRSGQEIEHVARVRLMAAEFRAWRLEHR